MFPSWRARRQLIVVLILAIPLVGLGIWLIPKFLPEPTCSDNRQNQGEIEVDCGGPCAPCELRNPAPIAVFWARAVPVRPGSFDAAALIENPNEVLASAKIEYEFSLFDERSQIGRQIGETFILPQERVHVVATGLATTREPRRVEFAVRAIEWQVFRGERPNFVVERRDYRVRDADGRLESVVEAVIQNRSPFDFREVGVHVLVLDREGNLLGANRLVLERFRSGERRTATSLWAGELKGEVATIVVEPRVNVFDPSVILKPR